MEKICKGKGEVLWIQKLKNNNNQIWDAWILPNLNKPIIKKHFWDNWRSLIRGWVVNVIKETVLILSWLWHSGPVKKCSFYINCWLSLSLEVMLYKVTKTQLNTKSLFLGYIQGRFLWASGHIFINWSIHSLVLSVFLFKDILFNVFIYLH